MSAFFPALTSMAESRGYGTGDKHSILGYRNRMNLRATYFFWYFSNGSRWQPEGRV